MALTKVTYVDETTLIEAQNLNDIQDEIIDEFSGLTDWMDKYAYISF